MDPVNNVCRPAGRTFGIDQKKQYTASDISDAIRKTKDEVYNNCNLKNNVDYGWLEGQVTITGNKVTGVKLSSVSPGISQEVVDNYIDTIKKFTLSTKSGRNIDFSTQIKKSG